MLHPAPKMAEMNHRSEGKGVRKFEGRPMRRMKKQFNDF